MLTLEVEFLTGEIVAANHDKTAVEWPPQPNRIFSALVASWGARGERAEERAALEWLERQDAPRIVAGDATARTIATVFVPPNDFKTSASNLDVLPSRRQHQARTFPSAHLADSVVRYVWPESPNDRMLTTLDGIARDTSYVGHSTSVTRCRFLAGDYDLASARAPRRGVYNGRLAELERLYNKGQRPGEGAVILSAPEAEHHSANTLFSSDYETQWIVLADDGGVVPDIRMAPIVARKLRDTLMSNYGRMGGSIPPEWLSGHLADGRPSLTPHAAFIPMANVGWEHSDGRLMGMAIVLPRSVESEALYAIVGACMEPRGEGHRNIELHYGARHPWCLQPLSASASRALQRASLSPQRWVRPSSLWATASPIALDRYPKQRDPEARSQEIAAQIAVACTNIGLPEPSYVGIDANALLSGAASAVTPASAQQWQRWQVPESLKGRYLTHAVIGFDETVSGPVILGAGRYVGLGLCKPIGKRVSQ